VTNLGRFATRVVAALALLIVLAGCQVHLTVDTKVEADGSGTVSVGVGLDDEALAKVGDLGAQLRVDDLRASGWTVTGPTREGDGNTWVRATKPFSDPAGATSVLNEVNGPEGAFGGWKVARSSSTLSTSYSVTGAADLTKGMATFSDQALSDALGGDPYGGGIAALEQEQGRPVSDMVDVRVTVEVPGATRTFTPSLADAKPTPVKVTASEFGPLVTVFAVGAALVVGGAVLVMLRRRANRHRRPSRR
jgi:hypothetical protein